jgi:hypothetical protein
MGRGEVLLMVGSPPRVRDDEGLEEGEGVEREGCQDGGERVSRGEGVERRGCREGLREGVETAERGSWEERVLRGWSVEMAGRGCREEGVERRGCWKGVRTKAAIENVELGPGWVYVRRPMLKMSSIEFDPGVGIGEVVLWYWQYVYDQGRGQMKDWGREMVQRGRVYEGRRWER